MDKREAQEDYEKVEAQWQEAANAAASRDPLCLKLKGAMEYLQSKLDKDDAPDSGATTQSSNKKTTP
jgi:hypothetical protein